jgi:ribonucleotide reductase beta subunit family protein with ferritin-like domain|tara:strand:+ start:10904 stop:12064 length:1161 start_codon:yes stop_codon:yes gene_type:complete
MGIEILSKIDCKYCDHAEDLCKKMNLEYIRVYTGKDELKKRCGPGGSVYPQVFVNDVYIGDYFSFQDFVEESEPMLLPTMNRFTVFPIEHENLWALYKKAQMSNWTAEEIDVSTDMEDWKSLSDNERHFIKYILAFFAGSDGIVFENINNNFADEVQLTEARSFYAYQCHNEMVHGETYSKLIDKYIRDTAEKKSLFEAIMTISSIKEKANWAMKWFDKSRPFAERLLAFACVEGIFFSGSFCAIFWLKKRGLLPGLCFSNELISRDEGLHLEFAIELFKLLKHKPSQEIVHSVVREAVAIEKSFILEALPCSLIGMNSEKMSEYIEYVSDRLLKQAGFDKIWNTQNPFDFMENISLDGKTNFFEKRVGDYGKIDDSTSVTFDEEF